MPVQNQYISRLLRWGDRLRSTHPAPVEDRPSSDVRLILDVDLGCSREPHPEFPDAFLDPVERAACQERGQQLSGHRSRTMLFRFGRPAAVDLDCDTFLLEHLRERTGGRTAALECDSPGLRHSRSG